MKQVVVKNIKLVLLCLLLLHQSCVESYTPKLSEKDKETILVVEGLITNETGPFRIKLTESVPLYNDPNQLYQEHPVNGAFVEIFDDVGNNFRLYEKNNGWYETENKELKAQTGRTYTLTITTPDGMEYESTPIIMVKTPGIKELRYSEDTITVIREQEVETEKQVKIMIDSESFDNDVGYLKWEFDETWEFELPTMIKVMHGTGENSRPATIEIVEIEPERKYCWVSESSKKMLVESTAANENNQVIDFVLQSISYPDDRLNIKYSILVKQYALNRELFSYFKKLHDLNEESGGMYDKNPAEIIGNIRCCNGEKKVLGYFFAAEARTKRIFISRFDHSLPLGSAYLNCGWDTNPPINQKYYFMAKDKSGSNIYSTNEYCVDCRKRGTNNKPDFWE